MTDHGAETYLLDSNIVIDAIRGEPQARRRLNEAEPGALAISALTEAELLFGVEKRRSKLKSGDPTPAILDQLTVLPWDSEAAKTYAVLRSGLEMIGKPLDRIDLLIASHALALRAVLVTRDQAFTQVPRLRLENWLA